MEQRLGGCRRHSQRDQCHNYDQSRSVDGILSSSLSDTTIPPALYKMYQIKIQFGFGDVCRQNNKNAQDLRVEHGHGAGFLGKTMCLLLALCYLGAGRQFASAANVMNYGADGNDYFQFTTPVMAFDKASGFTTLITFAMHVDVDGMLEIGGGPVCSNGVYIGPSNWGTIVNTLKMPPTTVTRYEVCVGGWLDTSYDNIKSLLQSQGTGASSMLYKNFQALKNAVPGIDAINDDDEKTYDLTSSVSFANLLGGLGFKFTMVPYTQQSFWVNLNNAVTNCDYI